ncbi:hypothetical protein TNCV_5067971 [Trichonephila clavipes]|uniref:Uncharacterized protein n=1 Tax=Trichonephila clavipes TaxID=2585209 RepID=A0A8X6R942_TRICX|nr:hypothetical protein TNCV_5067971 [Trichonephila clavipes]
MLSFIAKLYDPLGLVGPIIVTAKVFRQKLWLLGLSWDAVVPNIEKSVNLKTSFKLQKKNVGDIFLTSRELIHARDALVRQAQTQEFNAELKALRMGNNIPPQTSRKPTPNSKKRKRAREDLIDAALMKVGGETDPEDLLLEFCSKSIKKYPPVAKK